MLTGRFRYADEKNQAQNFSFKCHRGDPVANASIRGQTDTAVYAVNAIEFNRAHGTFVTAGSDGTLSFWDKDQRTRLKSEFICRRAGPLLMICSLQHQGPSERRRKPKDSGDTDR